MANRYDYDPERNFDRERGTDREREWDRERSEFRRDRWAEGKDRWGNPQRSEGWDQQERYGQTGRGSDWDERERERSERGDWSVPRADWEREDRGGRRQEPSRHRGSSYGRSSGDPRVGYSDFNPMGSFRPQGSFGHMSSWGTRGDYGFQGGYGGGLGSSGSSTEGYGTGYTGGLGTYSEGRFSGRGPKSWKRSDERIREDINERLTHHPEIDATEIDVQVKDCEVTLTGSVDHRYAKRMAEDIAEAVLGVRDVHNQIRVGQRHEILGGESFKGNSTKQR